MARSERRPDVRAMRIAGMAAIVCTCLSLAALFLPSGELVIREPMATHRAARSLYELGKSSGAVRGFLAKYRTSTAKKLGAKALDKLAPHLPDRYRGPAAELQDALTVLDGLRDRDIDTAGKVMTTILWSLISLQVLLILLVQGTEATTSRIRIYLALLIALLATAVAIGVYLALQRIVATANAELERELFRLRSGSWLLPASALAATVAVVAWLVGHARARGQLRAIAAAPSPASPPPPPASPPPAPPAPDGGGDLSHGA